MYICMCAAEVGRESATAAWPIDCFYMFVASIDLREYLIMSGLTVA